MWTRLEDVDFGLTVGKRERFNAARGIYERYRSTFLRIRIISGVARAFIDLPQTWARIGGSSTLQVFFNISFYK